MIAILKGKEIKKELEAHGIWFFESIPYLPLLAFCPDNGTHHIIEDEIPVRNEIFSYHPHFEENIRILEFDSEIWNI